MSVMDAVLMLVVPVVVIYLVIVVLVVAPKAARRPRYRVGRPWPYSPRWWTANPEGARLAGVEHDGDAAGAGAGAERGQFSGSW